MKRKATKIIELVISDESEELTIDAISLVTSPAIEQDFVFFGKDKNNLTLAKIDEEKRMLVSPALIPNKQIFRYDPNTDSNYYVYFSKETVRQASELYLKHNNHHKATYQHEDRVSGVLTIESWIKEGEQDKSKLYGFDLPDGTWFVKMKIENDEMWNKIKDGELKGLSIEGYFINKMEKMGKQQFSNEEIRTALKELLSVKKVELSLYSDLLNRNKTIKKELPNKQSDINEDISILKRKVKLALDFAETSVEYLESDLDKFAKATKELGLKPDDNDVYKDASKTVTQAKEEVKYYNKVINSIKNYG
tara:strand:+ start:7835 stop:8755 length:921 start_codon:yes stop_codon:yes gene_type:complete